MKNMPLYKCPRCLAVYEEREHLAAHFTDQPACAQEACLQMFALGLGKQWRKIFSATPDRDPAAEQGLNEFGDKVGYAGTMAGIGLIICTLGFIAGAIAAIAGV